MSLSHELNQKCCVGADLS